MNKGMYRWKMSVCIKMFVHLVIILAYLNAHVIQRIHANYITGVWLQGFWIPTAGWEFGWETNILINNPINNFFIYIIFRDNS